MQLDFFNVHDSSAKFENINTCSQEACRQIFILVAQWICGFGNEDSLLSKTYQFYPSFPYILFRKKNFTREVFKCSSDCRIFFALSWSTLFLQLDQQNKMKIICTMLSGKQNQAALIFIYQINIALKIDLVCRTSKEKRNYILFMLKVF